jgi:hypothetical protein
VTTGRFKSGSGAAQWDDGRLGSVDPIAEAGSDAALREDAAAIHLTAIHSKMASKDRSDTVAASTAFAVESATGL